MPDTPSAPMQAIIERIDAGGRITLDAGVGTELQMRGADMHPDVWCAMAHMTNPDIAVEIHRDYINAGADIITANSFSTGRGMMEPAGLGDRSVAATQRAVALAMQARDEVAASRPVAVAGSISHQIPVLNGTAMRDPAARPGMAKARSNFDESATTLAEAGVDLIMMEMMYDPEQAALAVEAASSVGLPVWVGMSARFKGDELLSFLHEEDVAFEDLARTVLSAGGDVAGIMHSSVNTVIPAINMIRNHFEGPVMAYPDSGEFKMPDWVFDNVIAPDAYAELAEDWRRDDIRIIGGCCGLGVKHIHALAG